MLAATVIGVIMIPALFVIFARMREWAKARPQPLAADAPPSS
jgi:hypothetical protein